MESYLVEQICIQIKSLSVGFSTVPTFNRGWFNMSLFGAQLDEFHGDIFIVLKRRPYNFFVKTNNSYILPEFFASSNNNHYTDLMEYLRHSKSSGSDDLNR